jgi:hypothetical protein
MGMSAAYKDNHVDNECVSVRVSDRQQVMVETSALGNLGK